MTEQTLALMDDVFDLVERAEAEAEPDHAARLFKLGAEKCRQALKLKGLDGQDADWFKSRLTTCCAGAEPAPSRPPALPARKGVTSRAS